jgi:hypothetical protein
MTYDQLVQLYFSRANALQWYWTLYVVIIGGLLAFSSLRQRKDAITAILVTVLYAGFAYKNLGAIRDVTGERFAILSAMKSIAPGGTPPPNSVDVERMRELLEPTLNPTTYEDARNFHVACDVLTIAALWAMELRRRRAAATATPGSSLSS